MSERNNRRRGWIEGSTLGAGVLLVVALVAMLNYLGWKYHQRWDWTSSRIYTLSEKSLEVLGTLDRDVEVIVFIRSGDELFGPVKEILERYEAASPRIRVRFVDPDRNLIEAQQLVDRYEVQSLNVVVFDTGGDRRVVEARDLAEYDYSGYQYGEAPQIKGFTGEERFTSTLLELMDERKPKVLFTRGHNELDPDAVGNDGFSQARDLLGKDNFEIESWQPLGQTAVPEGTDLLVIAGPTEPFLPEEVTLFEAYWKRGGRILLLLDPTLARGGKSLVDLGLSRWLAGLGVDLGDDLVIDPANPLPFFGPETIFVDDYGSHEITRALDQLRSPVILPLARSVGRGEVPDGLEATELLRTTAQGWGETDFGALDHAAADDADRKGPVPLGVALEWRSQEDEGSESPEMTEETGDAETATPAPAAPEDPAHDARLVVLGDSDFASNAQIANAGNAVLLANAFNWLVAREQLLGIPPKKPEQVRLNLSSDQLTGIYLLVLLLLPGLAAATGLWVFLRRRR